MKRKADIKRTQLNRKRPFSLGFCGVGSNAQTTQEIIRSASIIKVTKLTRALFFL